MPHRVEKAVKRIDSLKTGVKEGEVLKRSVVDIAMSGAREGWIPEFLDQFTAFQVPFDREVLESTTAGTLLAND